MVLVSVLACRGVGGTFERVCIIQLIQVKCRRDTLTVESVLRYSHVIELIIY